MFQLNVSIRTISVWKIVHFDIRMRTLEFIIFNINNFIINLI